MNAKRSRWGSFFLVLKVLLVIGLIAFPLINPWVRFLISTQRAPIDWPSSIWPLLLIGFSIYVLVSITRESGSLLLIFLTSIYVLFLLIGNFSLYYWNYGSTRNFSICLSHLDAVYFTLGTLSTAGTGTISATSELAIGLQSLQMLFDIAFLVFAAGMVVARFSESLPPGGIRGRS